MFNEDFYPTPQHLCAKMTQGYNMRNKYVLEPSAGKGDLASACAARGATVHCIEAQQELCDILRGAGRRVLHNDFLQFVPTFHYEFIVMNPPFSQGAKHLLHAWQVADGATIICLLNAETLRNPCTQEREQLAKIIAEHGAQVEYIAGAFLGAERRTGVEVALVTLKKPAKETTTYFSLASLAAQEAGVEEFMGTELATRDRVFNRVTALRIAIEELRLASLHLKKFKHYAKAAGLFSHGIEQRHLDRSADSAGAFNEAVEQMHAEAWQGFFNDKEFSKLITSSVKADFKKQGALHAQTDFSEANILAFLELMHGTRGAIIERTIADVFDRLCTYGKGENKLHVNTWKTNGAYKINKKLIVPVQHGAATGQWYSYSYEHLDDLEKALCFITGDNFGSIKSLSSMLHDFTCYGTHRDDKSLPLYGTHHDTKFFTAKFYKKGTAHFTFKDDYVWAQFNQIAAKGKNWIGCD